MESSGVSAAPLTDRLLEFLNYGLPGFALAVLLLTFYLVKQSKGSDKEYHNSLKSYMAVTVVFVLISATVSIVQLLRPEPPIFDETLLTGGSWRQHWAGENWITEAEFRDEGEGLVFRAVTYEVIGTNMRGRRLYEWSSNGHVELDAKRLRFTGVRRHVPSGKEYATKFEFAPGVSMIGGYAGTNEPGYKNKLRFYSAEDDTVRVVPTLEYCRAHRSTGACDSPILPVNRP